MQPSVQPTLGITSAVNAKRPWTDINGIDDGYNVELCPLPDLYCAKTVIILFVTGTS